MPLPTEHAIAEWVGQNVGSFHAKRLESLGTMDLRRLLKRKNLYLFRAKNLLTAGAVVATLLDAHLSSQEETLFGDFLESLAIWINHAVYGGRKSTATGIDLEFDRDGVRYIVAIKSGPNWGNSGQIREMKANFVSACRILRTGNNRQQIEAINGCCYGRNRVEDKGTYRKLCGQSFWSFISGSENLYANIVVPLAHDAAERDGSFKSEYAKVVNRFTSELVADFCASDGALDWNALVQFNSGREPPKLRRRTLPR